ncbi:MAG: hypothetical protein ACXWHG_08885, partial [Thermoanaerobaculia bacterium]
MRSHADTDLPLTIDSPETAESSNSLAHVMGVLRRYAGVIAVSVLAVAFLYLIVAIAVYVFGEAQQVTSLPFRVVFEGADAGTYPNGLKFNSSEIVATPVLQRVYTASNLSRFIGFSALKSRVFVLEANKDLDRLSLEYQAKLAEPRLSPMERDRLEKEYDLKKESLRRAEYSLNMALDDDTKSIPRGLRSEVLNSILRTWGEQAMQEKGAGMYRIPMLSRNIFAADTSLQSLDYVVAVDVLRSKANRVISTIDQLLRVPGSEVVRTGAEQTTLPEIRSNLEDIVRYRIEPLIAKVRAYRLSKQPGEADRFLQSQLESARRARDQRRGAVAALQNSL